MAAIRPWIRVARPRAFHAFAVPLIFGHALAWELAGAFHLAVVALVVPFWACAQFFVLAANDWADAEADSVHAGTAISGGSRVIPEGQLSRRAVGRGAVASGILLLAWCGAMGAVLDRPLMPWFGLGVVSAIWAYSYPPLRLSYRGGGEWAQAFGIGLVLTVGAFYAQAGAVEAFPLGVLAAIVLLSAATSVAAMLPDLHADARVGKRTTAVHLGPVRARRVVLATVALGGAALVLLTPGLGAVARALAALPAAAVVAGTVPEGLGASAHSSVRFVVLVVGGVNLLHCTLAIALVAS